MTNFFSCNPSLCHSLYFTNCFPFGISLSPYFHFLTVLSLCVYLHTSLYFHSPCDFPHSCTFLSYSMTEASTQLLLNLMTLMNLDSGASDSALISFKVVSLVTVKHVVLLERIHNHINDMKFWNEFNDDAPVFLQMFPTVPVPLVARSEARTIFNRSNTGIVFSNPARGMDMCPRSSVFCCPV
jgi:hypothetical protein